MSTELEEGTDAKSASSFQSPLRTLLIDNYDSFSYNIVQLMAVEYGAEPIVVYNDTPWHVVRDLLPKVDAVVISPGPGHPAVPKDIGVCDPILRHCSLPIFGVCLGLQVRRVYLLEYVCAYFLVYIDSHPSVSLLTVTLPPFLYL